MGIENLKQMFAPQKVAVVGANERKGSIGCAIMKNLLSGDFQGKVWPVNPNHEKVMDIPAYPSPKDLPEKPDLAVIATPIETVAGILSQCRGTGGAVIISAGGKETGPEGKKIEQEIIKEAEKHQVRIIGPNSIGIISTPSGLNAGFASQMPWAGKTAFISQSGSIYTAVLDLSRRERVGFSYFVSLGTMPDVDFADMIDFLGDDPQVTRIVLYLENLSNIRQFMSAARSVSRIKPIMAYKAGRSPEGMAAAFSHTGALTGEDRIYDAAFARAGILRVRTFEELFDCAEMIAKQPRLKGQGLCIITNGGGLGVMAVDALSDYGGAPARLEEETLAKLDKVLPPWWSRSNPVDLTGNADALRYQQAVEICLGAPEISALLVMLSPHALSQPLETAEILKDTLAKAKIPTFTVWMGGAGVEAGMETLNQAGVATFETPERAVRAFMRLHRYNRSLEALYEIPSRDYVDKHFDQQKARQIIDQAISEENMFLGVIESKKLLSAYGIPVNPSYFAETREKAQEMAGRAGYPVAVKLASPDVSHKTSIGGVHLMLHDDRAVGKAFDEIMENVKQMKADIRADGVSVEPMFWKQGYEFLVGAKNDREFGPVILFGMGGIFTELIRDTGMGLPPLNRPLARRILEETRAYQLITGYRNFPGANQKAIEEVLIRISQLVVDFPEILELDMNPLMVSEDHVAVVDARIHLRPSFVNSPMHLVISPYPSRYEEEKTAKNGETIFIRPIRPEDAQRLTDLFEKLSSKSIYYRFFSPIRKISKDMLIRFTQIDYDRQIALVAVKEEDQAEPLLGVCRIILERNGKEGEFAVLIRDDCQGQGIGSSLLYKCLTIAKERGVEKVTGIVLAENKGMLGLGKKLGFTQTREPHTNEYNLEISLENLS